MNILYLCADRGIPIRGHKGAAVHVRALTDAFVAAGHTVTILTPRSGPADGPAPQAEIIECPLPAFSSSSADPLTQRDEQAHAYAETLTRFALDWLAKHPCAAIYERYSLWSDVGARLRAATGLPLILEVNAPLRLEAAQHRHLSHEALAAQIEATQFAAADFLAVVSEPLANYAVAHGAAPASVHVVPNGVDPHHFHPAVRGGAVRHRYGLNGRIVIGFAGRMRPWHDGPTLLRAFARLHAQNPAYHLLLVGEMSPEMTEGVEALGLATAVTCTGAVPHTAVPEHLAAMDVAISSHAPASDEDFYFSPLKLFEYLACGVPTVAANVGQPGQLIQPGHNGYLYPPGDDAALAETIQHLLHDPVQAREIAWNGASLVLQTYTWAQNAARVLAWLKPTAVAPQRAAELPILDPKLRQRLYRATRPDLALPLLARQMSSFNKKGNYRLERLAVDAVLKYKPGRRCVLRYDLFGQHKKSGQPLYRQVIGKVFRDDRGERLLALQALLYQGDFGPESADKISVPEALAYVPEMRMMVQECVPGQTLDQLSVQGEIGPQVVRAAAGLAKLHGTQAFAGVAFNGKPMLKRYTLDHELRGLDDYTARLAEVRPEAMSQVTPLRLALQRWGESVPAVKTAVPLHRDFYYSQVLFNGPYLNLIDFDLMAWGDPAVDVANFTAHLTYLGLEQFGDLNRFDEAQADFLATYTTAVAPDPTFATRLAFYQATTFFRLLNVIAPRPAVRHLFPALLAHTQKQVEAIQGELA